MRKYLPALLLPLLFIAAAVPSLLAQPSGGGGPGPVPSPWKLQGTAISPVNQGTCMTFPENVTGGCQGPGSANFSAVTVNGAPISALGLAAGNIWIGDGSNTAAAQTMSGDCTITMLGVISCVAPSIEVGATGIDNGTPQQLLFNDGNVLGEIALAVDSVLVSNPAGAPSWATALPNAITTVTQTPGDNSTRLASTAYVDNAASTALSTALNEVGVAMPVGVCLPFAGSTAPNANWQLAAGQAISRTTFSAAFAIYGTTYGAGDGSTTFNLPDLRGRAVFGGDSMGGTPANRLGSGPAGGVTGAADPGASGGAQSHSLTAVQNGPHAHGVSDPGHQHAGAGASSTNIAFANSATFYANAGGTGASAYIGFGGITTDVRSTGISIQSSGSGTAHNITPPALVMNQICKVQ